MNEEDINKILQKMKIPEPNDSKKKATIKAAMTEFNKQKYANQKNLKGIEGERRLTGKSRTFLTVLGEFAMKKSFVITGCATACIAILVVGLSYFSVYKPAYIKEPATQIIVSQESGASIKRQISNVELEREASLNVNVVDDREQNFSEENRKGSLIKREKKDNHMMPGDKESSSMTEVKELEEGAEINIPSASIRSKAKAKEELSKIVARKPIAIDKLRANIHESKIRSDPNQAFKNSRIFTGGLDVLAPIPQEPVFNEYQDTGKDKFENISTNPVKLVSEDPVSTFSVDVDTASYAFIRRQLNHGALPQKNSIRVEEMINYFDYDYSVPTDKTRPFQPTIAVYPTPWNPNTKLLHIGIKGYEIVPEKKPVSNLVFLLDVSGSMNSQDKLPLLKNSFRMLVNSLDEEDTISIVVYAGAAGTVLEPTKVKEKGKILAALDRLQAGGSTAGGEGIRKAYELAQANFNKEGVNRVILATDGDFNVGIQNPEELKSFIERKRNTGIFLSVLGFGQGNYNDALMQKLAQNGNGNAAYIDNLNEARKVLVDEANSTLFTIAKDVKIQIEFNPNRIAEYRLIGYETRLLNREDFNNDKVDAGDIGSGHSVTAIYEITPVDSKAKLIDNLRYNNEVSEKDNQRSFSEEYAFLKIRYKLPDSDTSQLTTTTINLENEYTHIDEVPVDIQFAASVAAFGQLLRGGTHTGEFTHEDITKLAKSSTGKDTFGYRHEFINLIRLAESIR
ncbi:MAG: vWA domain-containing protein [Planctomycetota bacterium]|jgi:Ca-activated chloride channel family protein